MGEVKSDQPLSLPETDHTTQDIEKQTETDTTSTQDGGQQQQQVAWDDPRETRNPKNWSTAMKILHSAIPCFLAFEM